MTAERDRLRKEVERLRETSDGIPRCRHGHPDEAYMMCNKDY